MIDAREEMYYEVIELFGHPALFTYSRIDRDKIPDGMFCYSIRHTEGNDEAPCMLEQDAFTDHMGTILCKTDFGLQTDTYIEMSIDDMDFLGYKQTIDKFIRKWELSSEPLPEVMQHQIKYDCETPRLAYSCMVA